MKLVNKRILITAGEPASISSEITIKALEKLKNKSNAELIILTDPILINHELTNSELDPIPNDDDANSGTNRLDLIDVSDKFHPVKSLTLTRLDDFIF